MNSKSVKIFALTLALSIFTQSAVLAEDRAESEKEKSRSEEYTKESKKKKIVYRSRSGGRTMANFRRA